MQNKVAKRHSEVINISDSALALGNVYKISNLEPPLYNSGKKFSAALSGKTMRRIRIFAQQPSTVQLGLSRKKTVLNN